MARSFDGINDVITITDAATFEVSTQMTLGVFMKWNSVPTGIEAICGKGRDTTNTYSYFLGNSGLANSTTNLNFALYDGVSNPEAVASSFEFTSATWYNVVGTYNGSAIRVIVDASTSASTNTTINPGNQTSSFFIGRWPNGGGGDYSPVTVGELALWNVVLSSSEIDAYSNGVSPNFIRRTALVLYLPLWGLASPEPDLSGNKNNGTVTGAVLADHAPIGSYTPPQHENESAT